MDTQHIMSHAKSMLLEEGGHPPMLYVSFTDNNQGGALVLHGLPSAPLDAAKAMFVIGYNWAEKHAGRNIASLCFICEVMGARRKLGTQLDLSNVKPFLHLQVIDLIPVPGESKPSLRFTVHCIEEIRDDAGNLLDLIPDDKPHETVCEGKTGCEAFLAGFGASRMSEEQQGQIIAEAKRATREQRIREEWEV